MEFVRHEPCYDRILFVLTMDRKKMKERLLIGKELEIRSRLQGSMDTDVLCDLTRPLGSFLTEFEHDPAGDWNLLGLSPLRETLYSNRWKQPALEQTVRDFLRLKFDSDDPLRMYVAFRIWNDYLIAREPRNREAACQRFMDKMSSFTMLFREESPLKFDSDTGNPKQFYISSQIFGSVPSEETRLGLWYPDNRRATECGAAYASFCPLVTYYLNKKLVS